MRRVTTPAPRRDLHVALLRDLGADLLGGVLGVGTALSTEQLEARYGVSRTVVREAVKVLESVGVLTARRRVGLVVRPPQEWDALSPLIVGWRLAGADRHRQLAEISELRRGVEPRTGEQVDVGEKYVPQFKAGKEIRERLNRS